MDSEITGLYEIWNYWLDSEIWLFFDHSEIMNQNWFLFSDLGIICPGPASAAPSVAAPAPAGAAPWEAFGGGAEPKRGA